MKLEKATVWMCILITLFLMLSLVVSTYGEVKAESIQESGAQMRIVVQILDINQQKKAADVNIVFFIDRFPYNESELTEWIVGAGDALITCNNTGETPSGWYYQGQSTETVWFLEGFGELFPFDSYDLRFELMFNSFFDVNCSLSPAGSQAYITGPNAYYLRDAWIVKQGLTFVDSMGRQEISFKVERSGNTFTGAVLEFLMPIIACYYLLAATLLLDPKKQLNERLAIYVALFVFVPTFLFAIQNYLPYRSSLCFPELLLANLVISTTIFGVFSVVGAKRLSPSINKRLDKFKIHHSNWDVVGVILALLFFVIIYFFTIYGKMVPAPSFIVSYVIIPAYFVWFPFENFKELSIKKSSKSIRALFLGTAISTISFLLALFISPIIVAFIIVYIGAFIAGLSIGFYTGKIKKSAPLSLLCGIFGSILAGIISGIVFGQALFGTVGSAAVIAGIINFGLWGYFPIGVTAVFGGLIGAILVQLRTSKLLRTGVSNVT